MATRRDFLRSSLSSSALVAFTPLVPSALARAARAAGPDRDGRVLVVVQLDGGNDGLNTVVPFADDGYAKHRTVLRLPVDRLHKITREVGLHPSMKGAAGLFEAGRLAVVQGVGYPNPSRSHFKSMAIWQSADANLPRTDRDVVSAEDRAALGWIGRALDEVRGPTNGTPGGVFVGTGSMPPALRGRRCPTSTLTRPEDSVLVLPNGIRPELPDPAPGEDLAAFVRRSTRDAYATADRMADVVRAADDGARYPTTALAGRLRVIARLLKGGVGARVFYTSQGSYDTHVAQLPTHATLLDELSGAVTAFLDDLTAAKLAERVTVLCFSEFGRRVRENGSLGTDHGTAGPVFLAGPAVRGGLIGRGPNLADLDDGDLRVGIDFRQVYATVLEDWLGLPARVVLRGEFERLNLFRG